VAGHDRRVALAGAALARAVRYQPEQIDAARTALNEAKVQAWVDKTLAEAPPHLTPETTRRLRRLLQGGGQS
jgi:hypothetical protein